MASYNERNLKTVLDKMTEEERESFANGLFEIIEVPDSLKKGNRNLSTVSANIGAAIRIIDPLQLPQNIRAKIENYVSKLSLDIFAP